MAVTQSQWAARVLADANLPTTPNNIKNIERWMTAEEPPSSWARDNNPLNVGGGYLRMSSLTQSARATAATIRQTNMRGIYDALARNAPLDTFSRAVVASPWAASHYGGTPLHLARIGVPGQKAASGTVGGASTGCAAHLGLGPVSACIISDSELRALKGGLLIAVGVGGFVVSMVVLAAFGLAKSHIGRRTPAGRVVQAVSPRRRRERSEDEETRQMERHARRVRAETGVQTAEHRRIEHATRAGQERYRPFDESDMTLARRSHERRPRARSRR